MSFLEVFDANVQFNEAKEYDKKTSSSVLASFLKEKT